jgi:hypothetical protein
MTMPFSCLAVGLFSVVIVASGCIGGERMEPLSLLGSIGPPQPDVVAGNGDGSSYDKAFVVRTTAAEVIGAEERYIFWECEPHRDVQSFAEHDGTLQRSKEFVKGTSYDVITLTRYDGTTRIFYFNTSHLQLETPRSRG